MPFYRFACRKCGNSKKKLMSYESAQAYTETCDKCNDPMTFAFGKPNALGKETRDEYRNMSTDLDVEQKVLERSNEHFQKHELPRMIEKEGREFAIRNGWLNEDGTVKK